MFIIYDLIRTYGKILIVVTAIVISLAGATCIVECVRPFVGDY